MIISSGNRSISVPGLGSQPHSYPPPGLGFAAGLRSSSSPPEDESITSDDRGGADDGAHNVSAASSVPFSHQYDFRSLSHSGQPPPPKAFLDTPPSSSGSGLQPLPIRSFPIPRPIASAADDFRDYDSILGPAEPILPSSGLSQEHQPRYPQKRDEDESELGPLMYRFPTDVAYNQSNSQHQRLTQGTQAHNLLHSAPTLTHRHSVHAPGYSNHHHTTVPPALSRHSSEHFDRYEQDHQRHEQRTRQSPERGHLQRGSNGRASSPQKGDSGLDSRATDYFPVQSVLHMLRKSTGGTTELEALENATTAGRMFGNDRSDDEAFLRHFADLAVGDGHSAMRRDALDMGFGPESGSGRPYQENNPHPSELSLPETTNSVIRPFLYDSFLSAADFPESRRDDIHYSFSQPRHHSLNMGSLEALRARAYRALGRDFVDELDILTSAGSGQAAGQYSGLGRGYSTVPPPGYICKLCFVEGHWLKNCNLYQYRRRSEYFHNYASAGMNPTSLSSAAVAAAAISRYDGLSISAALRGLSSRHSPTHMLSSANRNVGKTTVPPDGYVCRKCHTPGHWIQQCTLPKQSVPPDGYTCKICLVKGHWIHQCPLRSGVNGGDVQAAAAAAAIRGGIAGF